MCQPSVVAFGMAFLGEQRGEKKRCSDSKIFHSTYPIPSDRVMLQSNTNRSGSAVLSNQNFEPSLGRRIQQWWLESAGRASWFPCSYGSASAKTKVAAELWLDCADTSPHRVTMSVHEIPNPVILSFLSRYPKSFRWTLAVFSFIVESPTYSLHLGTKRTG